MSEIERESMPVDVLFVGGGPACLAGAIHLMDLIAKHNEGVASGTVQGAAINEPTIALIEKGSEIGSHAISGAVLCLGQQILRTKTSNDHGNDQA